MSATLIARVLIVAAALGVYIRLYVRTWSTFSLLCCIFE
jgi:hypothetical protein